MPCAYYNIQLPLLLAQIDDTLFRCLCNQRLCTNLLLHAAVEFIHQGAHHVVFQELLSPQVCSSFLRKFS